jgi:hypothetical protein
MNPLQTQWFVIREGEHKGRAHLSGWMLSAIPIQRFLPTESRWLAYASCPRCFAMVISDEHSSVGDLTWSHEQWHAATDFPIPDDVAAQVKDHSKE